MCTRSKEQMDCGSNPLSYLGAFRLLWWSFGVVSVEFLYICCDGTKTAKASMRSHPMDSGRLIAIWQIL